MSPLPGWQIIPPKWAETFQPSAAATMTTYCEVRRSAGPPPYPLPPEWTPDVLVWSARCRLQELKRENSPHPGLQPTEIRQYLVALPFVNDEGVPSPRLRTGESGDEVHIDGRVFLLKQYMSGSLLWEQDFVATENQTQQEV